MAGDAMQALNPDRRSRILEHVLTHVLPHALIALRAPSKQKSHALSYSSHTRCSLGCDLIMHQPRSAHSRDKIESLQLSIEDSAAAGVCSVHSTTIGRRHAITGRPVALTNDDEGMPLTRPPLPALHVLVLASVSRGTSGRGALSLRAERAIPIYAAAACGRSRPWKLSLSMPSG